MTTVLVTGGYGFLGRAVARLFKSEGYRVIGIGNGRWSSAEALLHGFDEWLDARVTMSGLLTLREKFDVVAHCAGNGSVGYSITNPLQDFNKTVESTAELLEFMRINNPTALLIYPSSAGVYGTKEDSPIKETDRLIPVSPYGYHKKMTEELCESYSISYGLRVAVIRFFSIYGPGLTKQLLWDASNKMSTATGDIIFWGTGEETRDWIYVDDAAKLILDLSRTDSHFIIINGGSGTKVTVRSILEMLGQELGTSARIVFNNTVREGDPRFYHADISQARLFGWNTAIQLRDGVRNYVKWFKGLNLD